MKVKEVYLPITQAEKIFEVIKQQLSITKDVQIFVDTELIEEFQINGSKHHVYEFNGISCHHYDKDDDGFGGETWYGYHETSLFSPLISSASFISNCNDYYQLVEFPNGKRPSDYLHYCVGFKELLLIKTDNNQM